MRTETDEKQFQQQRASGLGGSDAAKIDRPLDIWLEKTGRRERPVQTDAMARGHRLETPALQFLAEALEPEGLVLQREPTFVRNAERPWQMCHPDGWLTHEGETQALAEAKTSRFRRGWGLEWTDQIPEHYLLQCQHNMDTCGLDVCYVPAYVGLDERIYVVHAHEGLQSWLREREEWLWGCIQDDRIPDEDEWGEVDLLDALKDLYPEHRREIMEATPATETLVDSLIEAEEAARQAEERRNALVVELQALLTDHAGLATARGRPISWRSHTRKSTSYSGYIKKLVALCEEHGVPEDTLAALEEQYVREKTIRPFRYSHLLPEEEDDE